MLYYLLLLGIPLANCCQSISQKQYNLKYKSPNVILFSAVTSVIALLFFLVTSRFQLDFQPALIPYALGFAIAYASAWVGTVMALRYGSMALSSLIVSCSLIFPTVYGILLGEAVTLKTLVGVALLFACIIMVNLKVDKSSRFSWKWFGCVMVAFLGNGVCSIMQNMQKRALGDSYTHEFMIIALSAAALLLFGYALCSGKNVRVQLRECLPFATMNGVANAVINFLTISLIGNIPNTVLYPTFNALNMIAAFLLGYFGYKERFGKWQYLGYVLGVLSIILLNL